jgi:hypothetical protein
MKIWVWTAILLTALWSGVWFIGAAGTERVIGVWLTDRESDGWVVNYNSLNTGGYPNRFNTHIEEITLADPETGWAWVADEFALQSPSYQPHRVTAILPPIQQLATPYEQLTITSDEITVTLEVEPRTELQLIQAQFILRGVVIDSSENWQTALRTATLDVTRLPETEQTYSIGFEANDLTPSVEARRRLNPADLLPDAIEVVRLNAEMTFDRPFDITTIEQSRPQITRIDLAELSAGWGNLVLRAAGRLDIDSNGYPTGDIAVRAENWRDMIALGVNAGAIPVEMRSMLEGGIGLLAGLSGDPQDIDASLSFRNHQIFFGPIPLGPAPQLILR